MVLRAQVGSTTGLTRHLVDGRVAVSAAVRIDDIAGGCLLVYLDENGASITDTWHASVADAKRQAHFEFRIDDSDWSQVP
jgi:hypothetical protein